MLWKWLTFCLPTHNIYPSTTFDMESTHHMTSATRPLAFSVCDIEKLGLACKAIIYLHVYSDIKGTAPWKLTAKPDKCGSMLCACKHRQYCESMLSTAIYRSNSMHVVMADRPKKWRLLLKTITNESTKVQTLSTVCQCCCEHAQNNVHCSIIERTYYNTTALSCITNG